MLVPAATSMGIRCSSSQRMTPTCAMPRALPPPNATPTVGRVASRTMSGGRSASGAGRARRGHFLERCGHPAHASARSPVTSPGIQVRPAPGRISCRTVRPMSAISGETLSLALLMIQSVVTPCMLATSLWIPLVEARTTGSKTIHVEPVDRASLRRMSAGSSSAPLLATAEVDAVTRRLEGRH